VFCVIIFFWKFTFTFIVTSKLTYILL
jgi:hypothetical protein